MSSCLLAFAVHADSQHVLILTDTSSERAQALITTHIRETLQRDLDDVEFFIESLDIVRFPELEQQTVVADFLRERYADRRIDAALAIGPASLAFLAERRAELFPDTPIVYGGVRAIGVPPDLPNSTGVVSSFDLGKTLDLALALQPDARRLVVISGVAALDQSWNAVAEALLEPYRSQLEVTYLAGLPKAKVLEEVGRLPRETIVVFLTMRQDGAGRALRGRPSDRARNRGSCDSSRVRSLRKLLGPGRRRGLCRALLRDGGCDGRVDAADSARREGG